MESYSWQATSELNLMMVSNFSTESFDGKNFRTESYDDKQLQY